ncbi:hypothetical protein P167DRAFT_601321 [Morchella conica CCBAS932]|uniref:Uncharacterized protein n=1 Tax=Morchella conica CCBAS932 TaxID=1392247 RepID=A0A3N4LHP9_9PEZI|nr:hypothetical protein P167DRAFT_601321 [Morchella conica CCBAS932]
MFSSFQQRFPLQDLKQWVPMLELFPLDPEALSAGPPDAEILLETFLPGSVYGLYQKGEMFPKPFWTLPPRKVFQTLPISTSLPLESISVPKVVVSSSDSELPIPAPRAIVAAEIPRVQTPLTSEIPAIRKKISTPSFNTRPSTPTRPGTPTCSSTPTRPSTPVDVRSSLPHSNSSSFSTLKKSPSVRDFLGTAANFAKETKPKPATQKDVAISTPVQVPAPTPVPAPTSVPTSAPAMASLPLERSVVSIEPLGDGPIVVRETKKQEMQKEHMALVQYYSPVIQVPRPDSAQYRTLDTQNTCRNETSYKSPEQSSPSLSKGLSSNVHSPKEEFGAVPMDPQYQALITRYLKKLQIEAVKVHSQFSPAPPTNNSPVLQQCSLIRFDRAFNRFDIPNSYFPEIHIESRHRDYVHHFIKKSVFKTAAAGSSRSIREVMQELRKDSIFLNTIEPGAILQALDDAVVARLRQSLSTQNNSITRFGDASARMDDLRRFLESLTKDNGQCVEFEHWIEEVPVDSEQTLPIKFTVDFANGTPAIRGTLSGPNVLKDSVRRRIKAFKPRPSQDSEFAFDTTVTTHGTPLKRTFGNKGSSTELRLYKRSRNGSSDDVSLQRPKSMFTKSRNTSSENISYIQRPKHLSIITTSSNEKMRAISNSSVRDLILSPINTSSTQIDVQISEAIFIESAPDSPSSTAGSMERWEQSSTLSRFSMGSSQTGITIPPSGPSVCLVSGRTSRKQTTEEERSARATQSFRSQSVRSLRSLRREPTSESRKEDDTQSLYSSSSPAPAFDINHFLRPKKCRSISEISLDNPKEYHAESLKRSFSSTSSLSKFAPATSRLPTVLSPVETEMPQILISDESGPMESSDLLDMVTQIVEPEDLPLAITVPMILEEPMRADSGFPSSDGKKSAHGLLKEVAGVGEDAKKLPQGTRKTTFIKDIKITAVKDTKDESKPVEERGTKKNKLFGRLKDRVKGLKKKVSGAMRSGKEN